MEFLESERQMEDGNDEDQQEKDGSMMVDNNAFATLIAEPLEDDIFPLALCDIRAQKVCERGDMLFVVFCFVLRDCVFVCASFSLCCLSLCWRLQRRILTCNLSLSLFSRDRIILSWMILGTAFEGGIYHGRILLPVETRSNRQTLCSWHFRVGMIRNVDENLFVDYVVPRGTLATELVGEDGVDGYSSVYGDTERRRVRWD